MQVDSDVESLQGSGEDELMEYNRNTKQEQQAAEEIEDDESMIEHEEIEEEIEEEMEEMIDESEAEIEEVSEYSEPDDANEDDLDS